MIQHADQVKALRRENALQRKLISSQHERITAQIRLISMLTERAARSERRSRALAVRVIGKSN